MYVRGGFGGTCGGGGTRGGEWGGGGGGVGTGQGRVVGSTSQRGGGNFFATFFKK